MRRLPVLLLALTLLAAACGDDDAADPASLETCDGVAAAGLELLESAIAEFDAMSIEELMALGESEEAPEPIQRLETNGAALADKAQELGCDEAEMEAALLEGVEGLEAESIFGQAILEAIRGGEVEIFGG